MQLKSLADILHVEIRDRRLFDDSTDPRAIVSLPIASFIESAFVNADGDGAKRDLSFESPDCKTSGTATVRLKFHLQADVLAALARASIGGRVGASVVAADASPRSSSAYSRGKDAERKMEADEAKTFSGAQQRQGRGWLVQLHDRGDQRFLSEPKSPAKQRNQFVNMLANCELPAAQRSRGRAKSRVVVKA